MINVEQLEAEQAEVNRNNEQYIKTLSLEDQAKFKAVSEAMDILTKAKVESFVFAMLPASQNTIHKQCFYAYNNFNEFNKPTNGVFTKENNIKASYLNHFLINAFVNFVHGLLLKNKASIKETFDFIYMVYCNSIKWCWEGIEPEHIKDLRK